MIADVLRTDLAQSMRAGDAMRTQVLRMLLSEMNYKSIDLGRSLEDADVVAVIQKEVKKRREAIESFTAGGRSEQAADEQKELEILSTYLPEQMSEEDVATEVEKIVAGVAERNFGQVMRVVAPQMRGKADGTLVANMVKKILERG